MKFIQIVLNAGTERAGLLGYAEIGHGIVCQGLLILSQQRMPW